MAANSPPPTRRRGTGTLRIGQIAGVDVLVGSSWFIIAALIAVAGAGVIEEVQPGLGSWRFVAGAAFAVLLYLSVLLHELSHALMAQRYGLPVRSITLHFLGGVTEIEGEPQTPGREFGVSVVGPLTSLAVGIAFWFLHLVVDEGLLGLAVGMMAWANLVVGVLNLVPGIPLDGGRVLRAVVWKATGDPHQGTIAAGWGGRLFAVLALGYPIIAESITDRPSDIFDYVMAAIIAGFLWSGASSAIVSAKVRRRLPVLRARNLARRAVTVAGDLPLAEAVRRAQEEQAGSIVVLGDDGLPTGVVNEAAVLATPDDRRPWLPVRAVTRSVENGLELPVDLAGEALIRAMQRTPASEYLLVEPDGRLFGVLVTEDVDRAFAASL